jgi:hypothetical protein
MSILPCVFDGHITFDCIFTIRSARRHERRSNLPFKALNTRPLEPLQMNLFGELVCIVWNRVCIYRVEWFPGPLRCNIASRAPWFYILPLDPIDAHTILTWRWSHLVNQTMSRTPCIHMPPKHTYLRIRVIRNTHTRYIQAQMQHHDSRKCKNASWCSQTFLSTRGKCTINEYCSLWCQLD